MLDLRKKQGLSGGFGCIRWKLGLPKTKYMWLRLISGANETLDDLPNMTEQE